MQKVQYDLKASNQASVRKYCDINFLRSPADQQLCSKITSSWKGYEIESKKPDKKETTQ